MEPSVKYQPKFGRVLIKREVQEKSAGGIIIPNAKRHAHSNGTIVALGETAGWTRSYDGQGNEIMIKSLNVGDKVVFGKHAGAWLDATYTGGNDEGTLFICADEDILAVTKED